MPKKDWGLENTGMLEIAEMMVGHSMLCGGLGFPCLLLALYEVLVTEITNHEDLSPGVLPAIESLSIGAVHEASLCIRYVFATSSAQ